MTCNAPDLSKLTDLQCSVWLKDQDGLRPIEIGEQLGLSTARVSNIKARLRVLGFPLHSYRRDSANIVREAMDDEQPDPDEPVMMGPVQRCKCGLAMPCNSCLSDVVDANTRRSDDSDWPEEGVSLRTHDDAGKNVGPTAQYFRRRKGGRAGGKGGFGERLG